MTENVCPLSTRLARAYVRYAPLALGKRWLWNRASWHWHPMQGRSVQGLTFAGVTSSTPDLHLWWFGVWEPDHTEWVTRSLAPGDVFVDVGAQIGYFSLVASQAVGPTGRVVAVEANPATFEQLRTNIALNAVDGATNIRALNMAASAEHAMVEVYAHPFDSCRSSILPSEGHVYGGEVEAAPLRDLVTEPEWRHARIIKIDVEGMEPEVVAGMEGVFGLLRDDCEIMVELNSRWGVEGARGILGQLARYGFHAYRLDPYAGDLYFRSRRPLYAERIEAPEEITVQTDVVFSRRDARRLSPVRA